MKQAIKAFMAIGTIVYGALGWTAGNMTVTITNSPMDINVAAGGKTLVDVTAITMGTTTYNAITAVATFADSLVLTLSASQSLTISNVATGGLHFHDTAAGATSVEITMKDQGDHFFGISEQNSSQTELNPDLRGTTVPLTAAAQENTCCETNAKAFAAVYYSTLGYVSFFDSYAEGNYVFGVGGQTTITHDASAINWYLFYGPTGDKCFPQFYSVIGAPKQVPIWATGLCYWNNNFASSSTTAPAVLTYGEEFNANHLPATVMWVDRPYSDGADGWGEMDFSAAFSTPAPAVWINQIASDTGYNTRVMTWVMPGTFCTPEPPAGDYFAGGNCYLDLTNPAAVTWYLNQLNTLQNAVGIHGHKQDRCEESMTQPLGDAWYDGTPTAEKQGKYLYLNAWVTDSSLRTAWGADEYNFARGAYHRVQPVLSGLWGGDTRAPWAGLQGTLGNGVKVGFMGFPCWGTDIGGYDAANKIPTQQFMRYLAFGVFVGFMENMLDGKEPWTYTLTTDSAGLGGETFMQRYAEFGALRLNLIPYTYTLENTSAKIGVVMRPLPYMYPTDANVDTIGDEYLFGPAMLVAPIYDDNNTRSVYLPSGTWYNFYNYALTYAGSQRLTTPTIPIYQNPVYIMANSIYPTGSIYPGNTVKWIGTAAFNAARYIEINAFPGTAAGVADTFTYMDYLDNNALKPLIVATGQTIDTEVTVTAPAMTVPETLMVRLNSAPASVVLNGATLTAADYQYNAATKKLTVENPAGVAADLVVNGGVTGTRPYYTPAFLHGSLEIRSAGDRISLLIPAASGIEAKQRLDVSLFNVAGKCVWNVSLPAFNQPTTVAVPAGRLGHGMYFGSVKVNGLTLGRAKIALP
jgi:alpha-glucosidase (family GH31 glycosyl hydrolase)